MDRIWRRWIERVIEWKGEKSQWNVLGGYLQGSKLAGKERRGDQTVHGNKQEGESEGCKVCGDARRQVEGVVLKATSFRWLKAEWKKEMERR